MQYTAFVLIALSLNSSAFAGVVPDGEQLSQRFRPYYKFTVDDGRERYRPCSWRWFVDHADLYKGKKLVASSAQLAENDYKGMLNVTDADIRYTRRPFAELELRPRSGALHGESWEAAIERGYGFYCQCEDAGEGCIVLTYWTLFAYNKTTVKGDHEGDIIAVTVVYDRRTDQLVRASYGIHGQVLESFALVPPKAENSASLEGHDSADRKVTVRSKRITCPRAYQDGPWWHGPSAPEVFLVEDTASGRYEHLAVFCEWGAHEPWPNPSGHVVTAPKHTGDDVSFLPKRVTYLGSFLNPTPEETPFVYFNGKWGNDPKGIIFHRSCFYPESRAKNHFKIPERVFVDRDPFDPHTLPWPPTK